MGKLINMSSVTSRPSAPRKMYSGGRSSVRVGSSKRLTRTPKTPIGGVQGGTDVICHNDDETLSPGCLYSDGIVECGAACPSSSN